MKITAVGAGYVGLSNAVLLAQQNEVVILDVVPEKVALLQRSESPIEDVDAVAGVAGMSAAAIPGCPREGTQMARFGMKIDALLRQMKRVCLIVVSAVVVPTILGK